MTNMKATKRALVSSALALFLCFAMLIGTTFAWFTDKVESKNNIIKAGNLDIELSYKNDEKTAWTPVTENSNIFKEGALWEPGHVEVVKLKVQNLGTLDLKYQLIVNIFSETGSTNVLGNSFLLSDYIQYGIVDGDVNYDTREEAVAAVKANAIKLNKKYTSTTVELKAKSDTESGEKIVTMVVFMPETVGNEANYRGNTAPEIKLGINLYATQLASEEDSFGPDYDEDANFPVNVPEAEVSPLNGTQLNINYRHVSDLNTSVPGTLSVGYQFLPTETYEEALESDYRYWHADFVVSADKDVPAEALALAGYYKAYCDNDFLDGDWIALTSPDDIAAGTEIRLVGAMAGITVNWEELCEYGNDGVGFRCGVIDKSEGALAGTTLTVELRMYPVGEQGECDIDSGCTHPYIECELDVEPIVVGKFVYTFQ